MKLKYHINWDELAELDAKWAILTAPDKKYNKWPEKEFFKTGELEINKLLKLIKDLNLKVQFGTALDFGCGIGRVAYALGEYYNKVYGVDISEKMIFEAKKYLKNKKIVFIQNTRNDLQCFENNQFDLIYSLITLQHIPDKKQIRSYLNEFIRILRPGGILYFQMPTISNYSFIKSILLKIRGLLYYFFVYKIGLPRKYCYSRLKIAPFMHMSYINSKDIKIFFQKTSSNMWVFNDNSRETIYVIQKSLDRDKAFGYAEEILELDSQNKQINAFIKHEL